MEDKELQHAMDLAEKLCARIYSMLSEEDKNDEALIVALIWTAIAIGLKSDLEASMLRIVVQYATDSALEEYIHSQETIH
tara:strand:- start:363 stop:602 length:240 start_codon:yes stop_codon:yes gene_type:complete